MLCSLWSLQWRPNGCLKSPALSLLTQAFILAQIKKHQSSASLTFVSGIHRWSVNSPHKWPVTRKIFPFDDVIMITQTQPPRYLVWDIVKQYCERTYHVHSSNLLASSYRYTSTEKMPVSNRIICRISHSDIYVICNMSSTTPIFNNRGNLRLDKWNWLKWMINCPKTTNSKVQRVMSFDWWWYGSIDP